MRPQGAAVAKSIGLCWLRKAEWDESKHKRDHGKFAHTAGGGDPVTFEKLDYVKTAALIRGLMMNHAGPRMVCW